MNLASANQRCASFQLGRIRAVGGVCRAVLALLARLVLAALLATDSAAQSGVEVLDPVVVTASRVEHSSFDLAASIDTVSRAQIQAGQWQVNSSESLVRVPGIHVQNRQAYAQDLQISSRGFGARSQFGVRGIRIIADDIPATMPDGQGQTGSFDLSSAIRIEVLRGPFSALYGNHSGGVVQLFTEDGPARPTLSGSYAAGSYGSWRSGLKFSGQAGQLNYLADVSRFATAGYRDHGAARRDQFNGKFRIDLANDARLTLVTGFLDQPNNQDPLGLTAAQVKQNPRQAIADALSSNTRRSLSNSQAGLVYEQEFGAADTLRLISYFGTRRNDQFLAIPFSVASVIKGSGGDSVIDRDFGGAGLRWTHRIGTVTLTSGLDWDHMKDVRTGYENNGGVRGQLRRDEDDIATSRGLYLQAEWLATPEWVLSGGLRASRVGFAVLDRFVMSSATTTNPNDSGTKSYSATTPVLGALYHLTPSVNLYANAGKGFETPTFVEMAYRPDGNPGVNFDLKPSKSNNFEAGVKTIIGDRARVNLALLSIDTQDETVIATNSLGRATFKNAGQTRRRGVELGVDRNFGDNGKGSIAFTYLDATYRESFQTCSATPCVQKMVRAGNRLPGVPRASLYAELVWRVPSMGLSTAVDARYAGRVYVDDFNSEYADRYAIANWRIGYEQLVGGVRFKEFMRIENLFDKRYNGAVYVGDANGRFYAPAPGRNWIIGVAASFAF